MNAEVVILIAEDDDGHALLIQKNLMRAKVCNTIIRFKDGQEALDFLFRRSSPGREPGLAYLLLLDIRMPKVDGVEVLRQIKQDPELRKLPVTMLTTTDDPKEVVHCHELGCNNYITKPIEYDSFIETVRQLGFFLSVVTVPQMNGDKGMPELTPGNTADQRSIVVVEDDEALLHLVQKNLHRAGLETEGFSDWRQALDRIVSSPPFLLLLDYQLSGVTGKEFIEALGRKNSSSPFIIMTGNGNEAIAVEMMKIGARDYMVKDSAFLDLLPSVVQQTVKNLEMENRLRRSEEERAKLEEQLRQAQKMEAIGTLAGGIAHDFNNILTPLFGYTDLAMQYIPEENPARAMLQEVLKASLRAKDLVKQILDFSRKSSQARCPVQIHLLIKETLKLLRASIPSTIEIKQNIPTDCGYITADPTEIHQLIMNLCTNAAQAMEESGGVLEVRLECTTLQQEDLSGEPRLKPGPYILLSVSDTGVGIPLSVRDKIFDPYFTTKADGKGSGMGLAMVQRIVKENCGLIRVHSQPGHGATFQIFLPQTASTMSADLIINDTAPKGSGHILFVDDEEAITRMAQNMLQILGYEVTTRTDSGLALELFRSQPDRFDLVITDQTMPVMTGEQLARELLRIRPDIPIILCTGYSPQMDEVQAKSLGISAFVMKPFNKKELAQTIKELLENKRILPDASGGQEGA